MLLLCSFIVLTEYASIKLSNHGCRGDELPYFQTLFFLILQKKKIVYYCSLCCYHGMQSILSLWTWRQSSLGRVMFACNEVFS